MPKRRCPQRYDFLLRSRRELPVISHSESRLLTQADFERMYPVFGSKIRYTIYVSRLIIEDIKAARRRSRRTANPAP